MFFISVLFFFFFAIWLAATETECLELTPAPKPVQISN